MSTSAIDDGTPVGRKEPFPSRGTALVAGWESTYLPSPDVDGMEATGHARSWAQDLRNVARAGVSHVRYPLRWHRIETEPGRYSWSETDTVLTTMRDVGLVPIVDLLHHTSYPSWLVDGFVDPRFRRSYVSFCAAVAERYPWLSAYTVFNEPFATTFLAGHEALWPPYGRGIASYVGLLRSVLPAIGEAAEQCRSALPHAAHVWVDTAEHHEGIGAGREHADLCNDRRHVLLDLFLGRGLDPARPFVRQLLAAGGQDLLEQPRGTIDVLGLDYYPHSEWFYDDEGAMAPSPRPVGLARVIGEYGRRYDVPLMVTETNIRGLPSDRVSWLRHVLEQYERALADGYRMHGLCWFPHLDSHDWDSLLALCRGRRDPVGVLEGTTRGGSRPTIFTAAWQAVAGGAHAKDLPAYRFQPPCDTQLQGFTSLMTGWPWQDPPAEATVSAHPVAAPRQPRAATGGGMMSRTNDTRDLVVVSHLRWTWVWQRPQHLVSRLAAQRAGDGMHTWFVEEPMRADVTAPTLRTERHGDVTRVWLEVPFLADAPAPAEPLTFDAPVDASYGQLLLRLLRDHGIWAPDVWMYTPMGIDLLSHLRPYRLVYDVMDDLSSFRNAPSGLRQRQETLLKAADVVFTGGRSLHEGVLRHRTEDVHLFPSGVESAHYACARSIRTPHARPVAGYVGVIDERVDLQLVARLAGLLRGWTVRMVGPTAKIHPSELPQAPNIEYPGMVSYADLPRVMAQFDVALMPFALNDATRSISPTKTLEYLAAGLPVLSTRVPDVVEAYANVVHLADDAEDFAAACQHLLTATDADQRDELAQPLLRRQEWDTIAAQMAQLLERVPVRPGTLPHDMDHAHRLGVQAATNGLQDAGLGSRRLSGAGVGELADAAVASATPFLRAPLLGRLSDVGRLHPRLGGTCPTCGTPVPCATAKALA